VFNLSPTLSSKGKKVKKLSFKKKKAVILLRMLEEIFLSRKKDYSYFLLKNILSGKETDEYTFFNEKVRIKKTYIKRGYHYVDCSNQIMQLLDWLELKYLFFDERQTKNKSIQICNPINFEYKSKKVINY